MGGHPAFGNELRRVREAASLSLAELGKLIHYSKGYLSKIESGARPANLKLAWACDNALGANGALAALVDLQPARENPKDPKPFSGLPPDSVHFTGRADELRRVISILRHEQKALIIPNMVVVSGMAGVGKTAFVTRVAYQIERSFPGGFLFLDLHGYSPTIPPVTPADALDRLLRRLGVPGEQIPDHVDDRAAQYRDRLIGKNMIIVLDNAGSADQVRPLLPATPDCRVLITSRDRLTSLDDACHLTLDTLPTAEATALFRSVAGQDAPDREEMIGKIVEACGRLPLAVRIIAARCRGGGTRRLADLSARVADRHSRLDELDDGERSVTSAFTVSHEGLPARPRRVFALLGLHPAADWDAYAVAALADLSVHEAERDLDRLLRANLVIEDSAGRYHFHDLVGLHARRLARSAIPEQEQRAAVQRLLVFSLATLVQADRVITPHRYLPPSAIVDKPPVTPALTGYRQALAWAETERTNLVALCRAAVELNLDAFCWEIAYLLRGYFFLTKQWDDWIQTHTLAIVAARHSGNRHAEARTLNNLGLALLERGSFDAAEQHYQSALEIFRELGDEFGESNALANHAAVLYYRGDHGAALLENKHALAFYERMKMLRNVAITLRSIALVEVELARFAEAIEHLHRALRVFTELGLHLDAAMAENCLGETYHRLGDLKNARRWHLQGLEHSQSCGSSYEEARAHGQLGNLAAEQGDRDTATHHWERALRHYAALQAPEAEKIRRRLSAGNRSLEAGPVSLTGPVPGDQ
ncbi:helix-turn-helix domain-containing protein [Acrocarpospora pleiomorpha]|uniref:helix-turn-helix domain-containing protein n=1 Tax=Acrocarpospora pleiomorpha TaxID=90975 RepID=UPI0012D2ADB5|nr:helix-turn-helix domain-containing protein [Acrocarpospora pleiomorpha]